MQSALVRKDAVMLHEPMRNHRRSTIIGVIAGAVGVVGFLVFGVISPAPSLPDTGIVISQQTGAVFVVAGTNPKKLIPATNMASAKLLLMALAGGSSSNSTPSVVDEKAMQGTPRDRLTGIFGAPDLLPTKDQLISPKWAVCDDTRPPATQPAKSTKPTTTVLGGVSALGQELGANQALLVSATKDEAWLVYRAPKGSSAPKGAAIVKAKVTADDATISALQKTYGINASNLEVRTISAGLLNAIPTVQPLAKPNFAGAGQTTSYSAKVGQVIQVNSAGSTDFYIALQDGIKPIPQSVAKFVQYTSALGDSSLSTVSADKANSWPNSRPSLAIDDFPVSTNLDVLDTTKMPVACFSWSLKDNQEQTTMTILPNVPLPNGMNAVQVSNAGTDLAFLLPGHAAVVRSAKSSDDFGRGPIVLVSDRGVKFGIPDAQTAGGLGLGNQFDPAPESIIKLLPSGPGMNQDEAQRQYDAVTVNDTVGTAPSKKPTAQNGG
jgi:type VII secretion protein EccB